MQYIYHDNESEFLILNDKVNIHPKREKLTQVMIRVPMFKLEHYCYLETKEQCEAYLAITTKDIEATDDKDNNNDNYEANRQLRIKTWADEKQRNIDLLFSKCPMHAANIR